MKFKLIFLILLFLLGQKVIIAQKNEELLRIKIQKATDTIFQLSHASGKDSTFYAILDRLGILVNQYKNQFGFNDFYSDRSLLYLRENFSRASIQDIALYEENIKLAQQHNNIKALYRNYHEFGNFYFNNGYSEKAAEYYQKSASLKRDEKDWTEYAYSLIDIGNLFFSSEQYDIAKSYYDKAKIVFTKYEKNKNSLGYFMALYTNNLGLISLNKKEYNKALQYFREGYRIRVENNQKVLYANSYLYFIRVFDETSMNDSLDFYYQKAISYQKSLGLNQDLITTLSVYGDYLTSQNKTKEAFSYFYEAIKCAKTHQFSPMLTRLYYSVGYQFYKESHTDSALKYLFLADSLASKFQQTQKQEIIIKSLIILYEKEGDYKQMVKYFKRYVKIVKENSQTETLKKEIEIAFAEQKKTDAMNASIAAQNRKIIIMQFIALSLFFVVIVISLIAAFRIRKQKKKLQAVLADRELIHSIIAHDLRGPLSGVYGGLDLIDKKEVEDIETILQIIAVSQRTFKSTFILLENLLEWANYQNSNSIFFPKNHNLKLIIDSVLLTLEQLINQKNIILESTVSEELIVFVDKFMLTAIIRNLISNSIKFSNSGTKIFLSAEVIKNQIKFSLTDQGRGMKEELVNLLLTTNKPITSMGNNNEKGSGLGMLIIKDFLKRNNGSLNIESELGKGSSFILFLPKGNLK